jgi:PhzF family phenazine biosynthesis protein
MIFLTACPPQTACGHCRDFPAARQAPRLQALYLAPTMRRRYAVVDVFSDRRLLGNPVAVVLDAEGLDTGAMQRIARWTNLSETTFLLPPTVAGASYRLRIFTPVSELPFAGHPTLGSAHAAVTEGIVARPGAALSLTQDCGAGLVQVQVEAADRYRLRLPEARCTPLGAADRAALEAALGGPTDAAVPLQVIDVGPRWVVGALADPAALLALRPDMTRLAAFERALGVTGCTLFAEASGADADGDIEVRSFAPSDGVPEDPVCGSGNGAVAVLRRALGRIAPGAAYVARQGRCVGRDGRVELSLDAAAAVWVGGACVTTVRGTIEA